MIQNSIRFGERKVNLQPFTVGTVVSLGKIQLPSRHENEVVIPEATGIWAITRCRTEQYLNNTYYTRFRDLWHAPDVIDQDVITIIGVEIEWFKYAYPNIYESVWELPNDYHQVFEIEGSLYQINQMIWGADRENRGALKVELTIHPLFRMADEPKISDHSQSGRTIEH